MNDSPGEDAGVGPSAGAVEEESAMSLGPPPGSRSVFPDAPEPGATEPGAAEPTGVERAATRGPMAPTTDWARPPLSESPPRPAVSAPYSRLAGPPLPPDPGTADESPRPRGRARRLLRGAGVVVVAVSLVSGGFALGTVLGDDSDSAAPTSTLRPAVDSESSSGAPTTDPVLPADVPGPLADEDAEEPVAAVAAVVLPSVVLIETNFGEGSGIVWDAENGYIVTNDHVVGDVSSVFVRAADGSQADGDVVGSSSAADVAVVKVDPSEITLSEAVFAPTGSVEVGQLAVAIGNPFGLDQSVTAGIVSAIRINPYGGSDPTSAVPVEMIQTDAPINPGNSGGALADRQGRVIGMNTSITTSGVSEGNVGIGFAVPSDTIVLMANRIVNGESLELGYLGVEGGADPDNEGVLVLRVVDGSPAEAAGLRVGDVIVGLDGRAMHEIEELSAAIKLYRPGEMVELEIQRNGDRLIAEAVLEALVEN